MRTNSLDYGPPDPPEHPCDICGKHYGDCQCPECAECGTCGVPLTEGFCDECFNQTHATETFNERRA